jgi:hypothetical protein
MPSFMLIRLYTFGTLFNLIQFCQSNFPGSISYEDLHYLLISMLFYSFKIVICYFFKRQLIKKMTTSLSTYVLRFEKEN